jgi:hypothetical protein
VATDRNEPGSRPPWAEEPTMMVRCKCGHVYTLHIHTVCPQCYRWSRFATALGQEAKKEPKREKP